MALTGRESRLDLIEREVRPLDDASVGDLVSRLAQEGRELAVVEVRRLRVEMKEQARRAARAAAAGYVAVDFIALASLALATGVFLVLGAWWDSYAAAAFATSGILALVAVIAAVAARKVLRGAIEHGHTEHRHEGGAVAGAPGTTGRVHRGT